MKVKMNHHLKTFDGQNLTTVINKAEVQLTIKLACVNALLTPEEHVSGVEKFRRYELAKKIDSCKDEVDLPAEDVTLIKELIGKFYSPLVVGQVYNLIENK